MNWYIAKIVFRIISGDGRHSAQFDEQLRLIEACNEIAAFEKAGNIGIGAEDSFLNAKKEIVRWQFVAVTEVNNIVSLHDGAEIYYRLHEADDAVTYINQARCRSALFANPANRLVKSKEK